MSARVSRAEMAARCFVTATGTGAGKTFVARGLARSLVQRGKRTLALKPIETGVDPDPLDALALERAARITDVAREPRFYRARAPLSPLGATLGGEPAPLPLTELAASIRAIEVERSCEITIVEGAGGLFVPYDADHDLAELPALLDATIVVVARDALGVLSDVLAVATAAEARSLAIRAVILARHGTPDASRTANAEILAARVDAPVLVMPESRDDDDALASAVDGSGLTAALFG